MSADWALTATPNGTPPTGVVAQSVEGSIAGADLFVLPGQEYSLTESGVEGYELQAVLRTVGADDPVDVRSIVLGPNDVATCTFLNDDLPETAPPVDPPPTSSTTTTIGPSASAASEPPSGNTSEPPSETPESGTPLAVTGGQSMSLLGFGLIILGLGVCLTELQIRRRA